MDLLASLLKQMVQRLSSVPQNIRELQEQHRHKRTRPSVEEISQALRSIVRRYSKALIVIDALDECQVSDGARRHFLNQLFNIQDKTATNIFITSRGIPDIERDLETRSTRLEIRASNEDLEKYLDGHMPKLPSFVSRSADLQKETKAAIITAVDGMYGSLVLPENPPMLTVPGFYWHNYT